MATLTVTKPTRAGVAGNAVAASGGGDEFPNDGRTVVRIVNGSGAPITVSADIKPSVDGGAVDDKSISVPGSGGIRYFGPFPVATYNDKETGRAKLTYSGVTSLTVEPIKIP